MNKPINYKELDVLNIKKMTFHNPKIDVANHSTRLLAGQGWEVTISSGDKVNEEKTKEMMETLKEINYDAFLKRQFFNNSYYGRHIGILDKSKEGKLLLNDARPQMFNQVGRVTFANQTQAVVWNVLFIDQTNYYIKTIYTTEKIQRQYFKEEEGKTQLTTNELTEKIPKEYLLPLEEVNTLGVLPVHEFLNKDINVFGSSQDYLYLSDDFSVAELPSVINQFERQRVLESITNVTRVFGNFTPAMLKKLNKEGHQMTDAMLAQFFINVPNRGEASGKMVEVQQANPQLEQYNQAIEATLKRYYQGCGYSYVTSDSDMSTNAGTLLNGKALDIETTKIKRNIAQRDNSLFIKKIGLVADILSEEDVVSFRIVENIVQSPETLISNQKLLVEMGLITKARALSNIMDISYEEAQAVVEEAKVEAREEQEYNMEQMELSDDPQSDTTQLNEADKNPVEKM